MSNKTLVRGAAVGGVLFCAITAGTGIASAAYLGAGGGVTTSGGGTATFTGAGFAGSSPVTVTVTSCGVSRTQVVTAAADGSFAAPTTGAQTTTFTATGKNPDGSAATITTSAVLDAKCAGAAAAVLPGTGGTGGTGGSGLPFTGFAAGAAGILGLGLVGGGAVIIVASRRRRQPGITS